MINYNFNRVFKARGIERPSSYLRKAGFSDNFATKVKYNNINSLRLKEVERLCILLRCTPNDFLEWVPEKDVSLDKEHPLNTIRKTDKVIDIVKSLNSIPLNELDQIEEFIKSKIKNKPQPEV